MSYNNEALARMLQTMSPQQVEKVYRELLLSREIARGSSTEMQQALEEKYNFFLIGKNVCTTGRA